MKNRHVFLPYTFVFPAFILIAIFVFYPIIGDFVTSFYDWSGIGEKIFIGSYNYQQLLKDSVFWTALKNNLLYALITTIGTILISFFLAVAIERRVKGWRFYKVVYFLPVTMPITIVGLLWGNLLDPSIGPINILLRYIGISPPLWLGDPNLVLYTLSFIRIWQFAGYPMIIFLAAMENISPEIHEAATIDGINDLQRIRYITLPLVRPVFLMYSVIQLIFSFRAFDLVWATTQGGPGDASTLLEVYLYKTAFQYTHFGYASAIAFVTILIVVPFSLLYLKFAYLDNDSNQ